MRAPAYYLPAIETQLDVDVRSMGGIEVAVPRLRPEQLRVAIDALRDAGQRLKARPVDDVLAVLDEVVARWRRPRYRLRELAEQVLPAVTGFAPAMIQHGLPLLLEPLNAVAIRTLLTAELGDYRALDDPMVDRPGFMTHVLSGNIPALGALPLLLSLAVKVPVLIKSAAGDPIFPALLAASIGEVDSALAACVAVAYWSGGNAELEEQAFDGADVVVASGSDAAIAAIGGRVRGTFIDHGHKVSFAAIGCERLADLQSATRLARRLAYDVSLWDQQGCLSPQLCYLEVGAVAPAAFAALLNDGLAEYARTLPPRRLSFEEKAAVLRFRQQADWSAAANISSEGTTDWSIALDAGAEFLPSCLNRCIRLKIVGHLEELPAMLAPHRRLLEGAGLACDAARRAGLETMLRSCGVHRVCEIGVMQTPDLSWRQGGRPRVADWVQGSGSQR